MKKTAFIYVILAGMLWGTSGVFFNLLEPYGFSSLQMTTMRAVISAACMVVYLAIKDKLYLLGDLLMWPIDFVRALLP